MNSEIISLVWAARAWTSKQSCLSAERLHHVSFSHPFIIKWAHVLKLCNVGRTSTWTWWWGSWTAACGGSSDPSQMAPCQWSFCKDTPGEDSDRVWQNLLPEESVRKPSLLFSSAHGPIPGLCLMEVKQGSWGERWPGNDCNLHNQNVFQILIFMILNQVKPVNESVPQTALWRARNGLTMCFSVWQMFVKDL